MTGDEMRDQLAAALGPRIDDAFAAHRTPLPMETVKHLADHFADVLLPVVRKIAADELRAVSNNVRHQAPGYVGRIDTADSIDDRADALAES